MGKAKIIAVESDPHQDRVAYKRLEESFKKYAITLPSKALAQPPAKMETVSIETDRNDCIIQGCVSLMFFEGSIFFSTRGLDRLR